MDCLVFGADDLLLWRWVGMKAVMYLMSWFWEGVICEVDHVIGVYK